MGEGGRQYESTNGRKAPSGLMQSTITRRGGTQPSNGEDPPAYGPVHVLFIYNHYQYMLFMYEAHAYPTVRVSCVWMCVMCMRMCVDELSYV